MRLALALLLAGCVHHEPNPGVVCGPLRYYVFPDVAVPEVTEAFSDFGPVFVPVESVDDAAEVFVEYGGSIEGRANAAVFRSPVSNCVKGAVIRLYLDPKVTPADELSRVIHHELAHVLGAED